MMKEKMSLDLITGVGFTNLPFYMGCEEGGMEASYRYPTREDSGEIETWDAPIDEIRDGLSAACVEALRVDTTWDWKKEGFIDVRRNKNERYNNG